MTTFMLMLPAALSLLALAAHFLRRGHPAGVIACLVLVALLGVPRTWATRAIQLALLGGAAIWLRTLADLSAARRAAGEPWERMALILGAVAVVSLLSALAYETPVLRRRDGRARALSAGENAPGKA